MLGAVKRIVDRTNWRIVRSIEAPDELPEATASDLLTLRSVRDYTMTSAERQWALINAVHHVCQAQVVGDIVECGVWRGGAAMAAALTLLGQGSTERRLWLFDTFEGMTAPGESDGATALGTWLRRRRTDGGSNWCRATLDEVRANLRSTGYPSEQIRFVKGRVEETLTDPTCLPEVIAVLRLDTDWYESTRVELECLYQRLAPGGVLIIDDYGYWQGARRAVDEFFAASGDKVLLNRIDTTGRIAVKPYAKPSLPDR